MSSDESPTMDEARFPPTSLSRHVASTPERAFRAFSDAWLFPVWLVGAAHIRDVDPSWPEVGSCLHHSVGGWPFLVSDSTTVLEFDPPHRLVLQARAWPLGEARVEISVRPDGDGCEITMTEAPLRGPAQWLDNPLQRWALRKRNTESLDRLATVIEKKPERPSDQ